jgi:pyruvate formate lyase activating enzyme
MLDGCGGHGGEPTLQTDLIPFLQKVKALGYSLKLDTNGSRPEIVQRCWARACAIISRGLQAPFRRYPAECAKARTRAECWKRSTCCWRRRGFRGAHHRFPQLTKDDLLTMARELPRCPLRAQPLPQARRLPPGDERASRRPYTQQEIREMACPGEVSPTYRVNQTPGSGKALALRGTGCFVLVPL